VKLLHSTCQEHVMNPISSCTLALVYDGGLWGKCSI